VWSHTEEELVDFIGRYNAAHPSIRFTHAYSQTEINFLDVNVKIDEGLQRAMGLSIPGLVASVLFYALIVAVGFWGARRRHGGGPRASPSEDLMLGGRSVGLVVGVFTVIATWVDGGLLSGIVEETALRGVLWCQAPVGFALSLVVVGAFFSGPMWRAGHVTMLDPLEQAFGSRATALLFLPALLGEVFWCGAILNALGATVSVITGLGHVTCVLVTASVVTVYTCIGGLYSITYTDVLQLLLMLVGLWTCVPFALSNEHVRPLGSLPPDQWLGSVLPWQVPSYIDNFLMISLRRCALAEPIPEGAFCKNRVPGQGSSLRRLPGYPGAFGTRSAPRTRCQSCQMARHVLHQRQWRPRVSSGRRFPVVPAAALDAAASHSSIGVLPGAGGCGRSRHVFGRRLHAQQRGTLHEERLRAAAEAQGR
ncbi:hypothetical protein HPB47_012971, partial [Ixodes persulcatus]